MVLTIPTVDKQEQSKGGNSGTRVKSLESKVAGISTVSKEEQIKLIIELLKKIIILLKEK